MTRFRPTPAAAGHRPRAAARFAAGVCAGPSCAEVFVLDRAIEPWARSRTCSPRCARRAGHRNRRPDNRHADLMTGYRLQVEADVQAREVAAGDEDLRPVTFREWLEGGAWNAGAHDDAA